MKTLLASFENLLEIRNYTHNKTAKRFKSNQIRRNCFCIWSLQNRSSHEKHNEILQTWLTWSILLADLLNSHTDY